MPMIRSVRLLNYRCVRDASFSLGPLTVFVGGNASGKSTLLRALRTNVRLSERDGWRHRGERILVQVGFEDGREFSREFKAPGTWNGTGVLYTEQFLTLDLKAMRSPQTVVLANELSIDGSNAVNVLASLGRQEQCQVSEQLCKLVKLYESVEQAPSAQSQGQFELRFRDRWDRKVIYSIDEVSDGTLLLFAYTLLAYQQHQPQLVLIEEPERGLHPFLLGELVAMLRKLSKGELGRPPIQVVMATHSPELLNHLEPEEVRFLRRESNDGSVVVENSPTGDPNWKTALHTYETLGSMWLSGGLGGVPGS